MECAILLPMTGTLSLVRHAYGQVRAGSQSNDSTLIVLQTATVRYAQLDS